MVFFKRTIGLIAVLVATWAQPAFGQPQYNIQAITLPGQSFSDIHAISSNGQYAIGTSDDTTIAWSRNQGTISLPSLPGRPFNFPQAINNSGIGAGFGATTFFGSSPLPGTWNVSQGTSAVVPFVSGDTLGRIYGINDSGLMAGSTDGGSLERAATYTSAGGTMISQTFANGGVLTTAYGINNSGRVIGQGLDPSNAAVTRGFFLDPGDSTATDIGALTELGHNSAIAFAISENGMIAGSSSFNSGVDARPFVWEEFSGMTEIPLLAGTSQGSAEGVNSQGWVVGDMSSATSVLFLYDGNASYRLQDLLVDATGWDLIGGTSNAALGIADDGTIVGRGMFNGQITGFVMTSVPEPSSGLCILVLLGVASGFRRPNRRLHNRQT